MAYNKNGFTLAEILITLGIIGVISAMTLPMLIAKYKELVFVTAAKKNYSVIVNAVNKWNADNSIVGEYLTFFSFANNDNDRLNALSKELNIIKICKNSNMSECGGEYNIKHAKRTNDGYGNVKNANGYLLGNRAVLADGTFLHVWSEVVNGTCDHPYFVYETDADGNYIDDASSSTGKKGKWKNTHNCGFIYFDTNGLKGPNQIGVDCFAVAFGIKPNSNDDYRGNLDYVMKNNKLIEVENYEFGEF